MSNYQIIYADPPWRYRNWSMKALTEYGEKWAKRNGRSPYPVLTTEDICKMPVKEVTDKNSLLCLWATWPKMEDALQVMDAWGYKFSTRLFTWVKLNPSGIGWHFGCGYHTHANDEVMILGKRGNGIPRVDKAISSLIIYPRGRHSAKPPVVRYRIERLYGDVKRVELFAREAVPNWDRFGNEVVCSPGTEPLWGCIVPPIEAILDEDEFQGLPVIDTIQASYDYGEQMRMM